MKFKISNTQKIESSDKMTFLIYKDLLFVLKDGNYVNPEWLFDEYSKFGTCIACEEVIKISDIFHKKA